MGDRSPQDDERDGLVGRTDLQLESLGLRRRGWAPLAIAEMLGVSTATVLRWWGPTAWEEWKPEPVPSPKSKKPKKIDLLAASRRNQIIRGEHPVPDLIRSSQARYEHQRQVRFARTGLKKQRRPRYTAPSTPGREIRPKQVPWVHEFE